jgi:hypothetical protein
MRRVLAAFGALACMAALAAPRSPPEFDPRAAIRGQVVDAETNAPIAGAAVIGLWEVELLPNPAEILLGLTIGGHGNVKRRIGYVREAVTDAEGRFEVPAWSVSDQWTIGTLPSYGGVVWFYAPGYAPASASLNVWAQGAATEGDPGLRGGGVVALYRPGARPREEQFRYGPPPTPAEIRFRELQALQSALDSASGENYAIGGSQDSFSLRVRAAQRHIRELLAPEIAKAYKESKAR